MYALLAHLVLLLHLAFVLFAVGGGLLAVRWPRIVRVHLPALAWALWVQASGWICPLTPLENALREAAGASAQAGDFVERTLMPIVYPPGLTPESQLLLGAGLLALNLFAYARLWRRRQHRGSSPPRRGAPESTGR